MNARALGTMIAPSVLREPYGHFGGAISMCVRGAPMDAAADAADAAVADWTANAARYAAEAHIQRFDEWPGRVGAVVVRRSLDGPTVVAGGSFSRWWYDSAQIVPWQVLRTVAVALARSLDAAGLQDATIIKPKTRNPPGRIHQVPNAVILRAVERRASDWSESKTQHRRLIDSARDWVRRAGDSIHLSLGRFPLAARDADLDSLVELIIDLDMHWTMAARSPAGAVAYADRGYRRFALGWGGRGVDPPQRSQMGERLGAAMGVLASTLDYGAISFDDRLWPVEPPSGAALMSLDLCDAADTMVSDVFWLQLLTAEHLRAAPQAIASVERVDDGRAILQLGSPDDWQTDMRQADLRSWGRALLEGCVVTRDAMQALATRRFADWVKANPTPMDPRPDWVVPVSVPHTMKRVTASAFRDWARNADHYVEEWTAEDGRELHVRQDRPGQSPTPGNPWVELGPGFRAQIIADSNGPVGVFWTQGERTFTVTTNDLGRSDALDVVMAIRNAH